jgi:hypothetical protein
MVMGLLSFVLTLTKEAVEISHETLVRDNPPSPPPNLRALSSVDG